MADVHCPESRTVRPMGDCMGCKLHVKDGSSLQWCGYIRTEVTRERIPINALRLQMEEKIKKAEYLYRTGKTRIADNYSYEATRLYLEIRRRRNEGI